MTIKTKLETLLQKANAKTKKNDSTLSAAIQNLIYGYSDNSPSISYEWDETAEVLRGTFNAEWTEIPKNCFYKNALLSLTELPSSLITIGDYAFYSCYSLALTELPSSLISIGNGAFYDCSKLALTKMPDHITDIGDRAFRSCSKMILTELPDSIISIGYETF